MIEHRTASSVYHAQETDDWCGAAVALTMLSDSDEKAVIEDLRQEAIYQLGHPANGDWSIDPGGLVRALNAKKPGGSRSFVLSDLDNNKLATARIVAAILAPGPVAPAALVLGDRHWVTVSSLDLDIDPVTGVYTPLRLFIFDPETLNSPPGIVHSVGDKCPVLGKPEYCILYPQGWETFFRGAPVEISRRFLNVLLEDVPLLSLPSAVSPPHGLVLARDGEGFIRRESVPAAWNAWAEVYGEPPVGSPAKGFWMKSVISVTKVRIPEESTLYHLICLGKSGAPEATVVMDGKSGAPLSMKIHTPASPYRNFLKRLGDELDGEELTWSPCLESFSPHLPFRLHPGGIYERLDARIFHGLTLNIKGA